MNALSPSVSLAGLARDAVPLIPDSAPFSAPQRAWLNGFLAGIYGAQQANASVAAAPAAEPADDHPWHDPALSLEERLALAAGRSPAERLMAAMAQLDCGQCGYVCKSYAAALASGAETSAALCVPGGKPTQKALKAMLAAAPTAAPVAAKPAAEPPAGREIGFVSAERLTGAASDKDVRHIVLDLAASGLAYEPGDSLAIHVANDPALVEAVLRALGVPEDEALRRALAEERDIARPLDRTLDLLAGCATHAPHTAALRRLADGEDEVEPQGADLLDLLEAFPSARPPVAALVESLPRLKPRLYSIASSPLAAPGRVELCVGVVRESRRGRARDGVASCHLAWRASPEVRLRASVQTSHFRLPADPAAPVIMVGPGTGIAPFRAFLQHREAIGAKGRAWLFFGDRRAATDFLFRDEIEGFRKRGTLTCLSLAWSRDVVATKGAAKDYVQHRMAEAAPDLWRWFQEGAHVYVCGDASRMATDVDAALRGLAQSEGGMSAEQARDWIVALARQGRYQRDVY